MTGRIFRKFPGMESTFAFRYIGLPEPQECAPKNELVTLLIVHGCMDRANPTATVQGLLN